MDLSFIKKRKLKVGDLCMFPRWGFYIFNSPNNTENARYMDTNPLTKSLDHCYIVITSVHDEENMIGCYIAGDREKESFYMRKSVVEKRDIVEQLLMIIFVLPFYLIGHFALWFVTVVGSLILKMFKKELL